LQQHARGQGGFRGVLVERGAQAFQPGDSTVEGDFCYEFPPSVNKIRVEFAIDTPDGNCQIKKKSNPESPCNPTHTCPGMFGDVPADNPYYTPAMSLSSNGVVSGYADGTFRPYSSVTRAQVAKIVVLAFGFPLATSDKQRFSDVAANDPMAGYIETAYAHGLVSGYADGTFRPTNSVTRGQLAKIVVVAAGLSPVTPAGAGASFRDVKAGSPFYGYVEAGYAQGLLSGYADGSFRPGAEANRGQVCKITMLAAFPAEE
jgi:hypothetical protein